MEGVGLKNTYMGEFHSFESRSNVTVSLKISTGWETYWAY